MPDPGDSPRRISTVSVTVPPTLPARLVVEARAISGAAQPAIALSIASFAPSRQRSARSVSVGTKLKQLRSTIATTSACV